LAGGPDVPYCNLPYCREPRPLGQPFCSDEHRRLWVEGVATVLDEALAFYEMPPVMRAGRPRPATHALIGPVAEDQLPELAALLVMFDHERRFADLVRRVEDR
jgi:hypothetical protein